MRIAVLGPFELGVLGGRQGMALPGSPARVAEPYTAERVIPLMLALEERR